MVHAGWFNDITWWWLAVYLLALGFAMPFGSGRKEYRS